MRFLLVSIAILLASSTASAQDINKAYQKEFAYLQAQKSSLEKRAAELERADQTESARERAVLDTLQGQLVSMQLRADTRATELAEVDRSAASSSDNADQLVSLLEQARASLAGYDVEVAITEQPNAKDVRGIFEKAATPLQAGGERRTEAGEFFLTDGQLAHGQITHIGRIAALGDGLPLAPAGDGRLKVWAGNSGGIFLFENPNATVEEKVEPTWIETIEAGGLVGWVIVALGLIGLLLAAWRVFALVRMLGPTGYLEEIARLVAVGRFTEAKRLADGQRGAVARVVSKVTAVIEEPETTIDDAVTEALLQEQPAIDRFGTAIMVFAAVAPLLGLLGTVTGMIATFDIITEYGTGDPKMLSSGISEALITTQLGLMVAIPCLLIGNLLNARAASVADTLERAALRIINASRTVVVEPAPEAVTPALGGALEGA